MLEPAQKHEGRIRAAYLDVMYDEEFMYEDPSVYRDVYEVKDSTWQAHNFASLNSKGELVGYMGYRINRESNCAYALTAINFQKGKFSPVFGRDLIQLIRDIFLKFNFRIMRFSVIVGNPAERMYDRYIERIGGRIIGTFTDECRLIDGKLYSMKYYEVKRDDFINQLKRDEAK